MGFATMLRTVSLVIVTAVTVTGLAPERAVAVEPLSCSDFDSRAAAQRYAGDNPRLVNNLLDMDRDGVVCETYNYDVRVGRPATVGQMVGVTFELEIGDAVPTGESLYVIYGDGLSDDGAGVARLAPARGNGVYAATVEVLVGPGDEIEYAFVRKAGGPPDLSGEPGAFAQLIYPSPPEMQFARTQVSEGIVIRTAVRLGSRGEIPSDVGDTGGGGLVLTPAGAR